MAKKSGTDAVNEQYDVFPYPARDPRDEAKRLLTGSPSRLGELNHYVFAGRRDFRRPFRVLVAGGGTGDATVMLAQQLADAGSPAEIVHVDLSEAAMRIAETRVKARRLDNVTFHRLSLLDLPSAGLGPFDYIDCCGVLHHLEDPAEGLAVLASVLADDGGMGLMLYGELGRSGVYPVQDLLRMIVGDEAPTAQVVTARRLLEALPPTNLLRRNPFLADHLKGGDAGLFDLLLHARDRAYRVPEIADLVAGGGLAITAFIEPAAYDPRIYVSDPALVKRFAALPWLERCAAAELLAGSLRKHVLYAVKANRPEPWVATPDDLQAVPVWREPADADAARKLNPGAVLTPTAGGVRFRVPLPPLAAAMAALVDGERTIREIHAGLRTTNPGLDDEGFRRQFSGFYAAFNGFGFLYLKRPAGARG